MPATEPLPFYRDSWARHYARGHYSIDDAIEAIYYLPGNSPEREIRFIEVNHAIAEMIHPEPIDFVIDSGGTYPHTLVVLDITPSQWEEVKNGARLLPSGWSLTGYQTLSRGDV